MKVSKDNVGEETVHDNQYEQFTFTSLKTGETRMVFQYPTYYAGCYLWGRIDLELGKERLFEVLKSRDGFLRAWELCR